MTLTSRIHGTHLKVASGAPSTLISSMRRLPRLSLVFYVLVFFLKTLIGEMALSSIVKTFDIGDIFFFFLESNINTFRRRVLASSLSLSIIVLKTSLVVLVFFLVGRRCLLPTGYVSKEDVDGLILLKVFIIFLCWSIPSETLGINFPDAWEWL